MTHVYSIRRLLYINIFKVFINLRDSGNYLLFEFDIFKAIKLCKEKEFIAFSNLREELIYKSKNKQ